MFTVLFAIPRTVGWLAQWEELVQDKEQKIAELELKCAHELGPSKVMLQTVSAVPHAQEEDIQIVNEMNERIAANFTNQEDANFVMSDNPELDKTIWNK